ncbi:MAG: SDR family oxidoreductase [Thermomicrobiales bacterium]|nr:SDR family oxidoreductase [Thermomicrobiales bacterium]
MELTFSGAPGAGRAVAIVTGVSRAQGIGAAVTRRLAASGVAVLATGWRSFDAISGNPAGSSDVDELLADVGADGGTVDWISADLANVSDIPGIFAAAEDRFGSVSILINNAAYSLRDGWQGLTAELMDAHYAVNQRGTALMTTEFARRWPGGTGGRVISLTSGQFKGPMLDEIAYIATKGAIDAMTITLSAELAPLGITVNAVGPGPNDTGWMTSDLEAVLLPQFPFGRIGQPDDAARLIAFLASDQADWITGQIIHSEGGFLRR